MANTFALKYSLPRLAQSLAQFWSSSEEAEWEECVLSLLEVTSSVALMTGERNILAVLDANVYGGVAEVRIQPCVILFLVFLGHLGFSFELNLFNKILRVAHNPTVYADGVCASPLRVVLEEAVQLMMYSVTR